MGFVPIIPCPDKNINNNFTGIGKAINGGLTLDNLACLTISGTTADTADTQSLHNHSMKPQPSIAIPMVGDVYIQSIDSKYVDVRSTKPGVNFLILLVSGTSDSKTISAATLDATGNDSYQTTDEQIQDNTPTVPPTSIGNLDDASVAQNLGAASGAPNGTILDCVTDGDYFYITCSTANTNVLTRVNRSTGTVDGLTLGSLALGRLYPVSGTTDLYVAQQTSGGTGQVITYLVDTTTFTSSTSYTSVTGSATGGVGGLYVDGTYIWLAFTTSTGNSRLCRHTISGGADTLLTLASTNRQALSVVEGQNGYLYVTEMNTGSAASNIYEVDKSSVTTNNTYTTPNRRLHMNNMIVIDDYILVPAVYNSSKSSTSQAITYSHLAVVLNTVAGTFSTTPIMQGGGGGHASFGSNIVYDETNGYVYFAVKYGDSNSAFGVMVIQGDISTGDQRSKWYPVSCTPSASVQAVNNVLVKDTDGSPILICDPGSLGGNFVWLPVDFDSDQTITNFGTLF